MEDKLRKISGSDTPFLKYIFPTIWISAVMLFLVFSIVQKAYLLTLLFTPFLFIIIAILIVHRKDKVADAVFLDYSKKLFVIMLKNNKVKVEKSFEDLRIVDRNESRL